MSNGEIIGYDYRMCACCGGTEITIENVQIQMEILFS